MEIPTFDHDGSAHATANEGTIRYLEFTLERNSGTSATMKKPIFRACTVLGKGFVEKLIDFRDAQILRGKLEVGTWEHEVFFVQRADRDVESPFLRHVRKC